MNRALNVHRFGIIILSSYIGLSGNASLLVALSLIFALTACYIYFSPFYLLGRFVYWNDQEFKEDVSNVQRFNSFLGFTLTFTILLISQSLPAVVPLIFIITVLSCLAVNNYCVGCQIYYRLNKLIKELGVSWQL